MFFHTNKSWRCSEKLLPWKFPTANPLKFDKEASIASVNPYAFINSFPSAQSPQIALIQNRLYTCWPSGSSTCCIECSTNNWPFRGLQRLQNAALSSWLSSMFLHLLTQLSSSHGGSTIMQICMIPGAAPKEKSAWSCALWCIQSGVNRSFSAASTAAVVPLTSYRGSCWDCSKPRVQSTTLSDQQKMLRHCTVTVANWQKNKMEKENKINWVSVAKHDTLQLREEEHIRTLQYLICSWLHQTWLDSPSSSFICPLIFIPRLGLVAI